MNRIVYMYSKLGPRAKEGKREIDIYDLISFSISSVSGFLSLRRFFLFCFEFRERREIKNDPQVRRVTN